MSPPEPSPLETLAIAIDPAGASAPIYVEASPSDLDFHALSAPLVGAVNLVPLVQIVEPLKAVTLTVASPGEAVPGQPLADPVEQRVVDFVASLPPPTLEAVPSSSVAAPGQFSADIVLPGEVVAAAEAMDPLPPLQALVADPQPLPADQGTLIIENVSIEPFLEADPSAVLSALQGSSTEMVAYFETIPTAPVSATASSGVTPPETVLSSALSLPIVSTVPIVSNQAALEASPAEELVAPEPLSPAESPEEQLEEHRYHRSEVTATELVDVVMGLQKKVKVLQQRHRRHCAKLEAMEGVVEQLRKENLVSEEKLKLLEMVGGGGAGAGPGAPWP